MKITENELLQDNVSEALYECIGDGYVSHSMLLCDVNASDGRKFQVHIVVTSDEHDFIENNEEMPEFNHDENYRLIEINSQP